MDEAASSTSSAMDSATDTAKNLAASVKDGAAKEMRATVDTGRQRAADALQQVARTLQGNGENLGDGEGTSGVNSYVAQAGSQLQRAADYLRDANVHELVAETERFARRQPALFLGGAFTVGLLAARMLKSGKAHSEQTLTANGNYQYGGRTPANNRQSFGGQDFGRSSGLSHDRTQDRELSRSVTRDASPDASRDSKPSRDSNAGGGNVGL